MDTPWTHAETTVVTLPGEIDMTSAPCVGQELAAAFAPGAGVVCGGLR